MRHAIAYLETAQLVVRDPALPDDYDYNHVAAGIAVLSAIAASDALCCHALGERARGQSHHDAVDLLSTLRLGPGRPEAQERHAEDLAASLATVLDLKDESHYGTSMLGSQQVRRLLRAADRLVSAASETVADVFRSEEP